MTSRTVRITFTEDTSGSSAYVLPLLQKILDPQEGIKANVIDGTRADGSIIIPGGKKSQKIEIEGILYDDGYDFVSISIAMATMRTSLTAETGTLTLEWLDGASWTTIWSYTVRRIGEIIFPSSMRTDMQAYKVEYIVLSY
ncbi:hypothetical protein LCGC14_2177580 [marine sediment metagenome]|uniref:Uncharacterized protein n=1 Tax=marine sediment metagenome TaxID=412755 RepID=A0A0F9DN70_9ZZZZ